MVTACHGNKDNCNFYFYNCVYILSLTLIAVMVLELFTIMFWKCRHYTPEPRFQSVNQET